MIDFCQRGGFLSSYIHSEAARLRSLAAKQGYTISPEPPSALFTNGATVECQGVLDAYDPLAAKVKTKVAPVWRPEALEMMDKLRGTGIDFTAYARGGGPYFNYPVKRIARWERYDKVLIKETPMLWTLPWWEELGLPKFIDMLRMYQAKTDANITKLEDDPSLLTIGKPGATGTGWDRPFQTRDDMVNNFKYRSDVFRYVTNQYYEDMIEAIQRWPYEDSMIEVGGGFKGITGGVRSDADIVSWDPMEIVSSAREVGNDPSSVFHGPGVNGSDERRAMFASTYSRHHMPLHDVNSLLEVLATPPATIPGDPDDTVLLSADVGFVDPAPHATDKELFVPDPRINFGADNISMAGIFLRTSNRAEIAMLKSGTPFTMAHYNIMFGAAISWYANELGLNIKFLQVGDDIQLLIKRDEIPHLLATPLGPYFKLKGMKGPSVFIVGHQQYFHDDGTLTSFIVPRALKSQTSAKRNAGEFPKEIQPGEEQTYVVDDETQENISKFWEQYKDLVYWHGPVADYIPAMQQLFGPGKLALADLGVSEWMSGADMFLEEDDLNMMAIPVETPTADFSHFESEKETDLEGAEAQVPRTDRSLPTVLDEEEPAEAADNVPCLLIAGLACSGKTTLATALLEAQRYKIKIDADSFHSAVNPAARAWESVTPEQRKTRSDLMLSIIKARVAATVMDGVWPGEHDDMVLNCKCPIVAFKPLDYATASARWIERGKPEGDFPWDEAEWDTLTQSMDRFAERFEDRIAAGAKIVSDLVESGLLYGEHEKALPEPEEEKPPEPEPEEKPAEEVEETSPPLEDTPEEE